METKFLINNHHLAIFAMNFRSKKYLTSNYIYKVFHITVKKNIYKENDFWYGFFNKIINRIHLIG